MKKQHEIEALAGIIRAKGFAALAEQFIKEPRTRVRIVRSVRMHLTKLDEALAERFYTLAERILISTGDMTV